MMNPHHFSFANPTCDSSFIQPEADQPPKKLPMSTDDLALEKASQEKKALLKSKMKQQRLYRKIKKTAAVNSLLNEMGLVKKKISYVQSLLDKGRQIMESERPKKKSLVVGRRVHRRKSLTEAKPFDLRTQKRVRVEAEVQLEEKQEYEPLWAQIQKSFRLRDTEQPDIMDKKAS